MAKQKLEMKLPSADDLFSTEEQRQEAKLTKLYDIPLAEIDDFPEHPYRVLDDEDMEGLMESIRERGVITPALVRKKDNGRYEMISGHRRKHACERLGLDTLRCEVVDVSRDEAIILMVDSNSQRSEIAPCDKGRAYKMKMDAMSRQGQRSDLTSRPVVDKSEKRTGEIIGEASGESERTVQRYIRLTYLISELQDFVDEGRIKMRPAVELSYLDEEAQRDVVDLIDETEAFPSHDQAIRMRKAFEAGKLDHAGVDAIMKEEKPNQRPTYKLKYEDIKAYFKPGALPDKVLADILKGLELLKKQRARENREAR